MQVEVIAIGGAWEGQANLAKSKLDHEYRWLKCAWCGTVDLVRAVVAAVISNVSSSFWLLPAAICRFTPGCSTNSALLAGHQAPALHNKSSCWATQSGPYPDPSMSFDAELIVSRRSLPPDTLVILLDGGDVLCWPCSRDIVAEFWALGGGAILMGGDLNPWCALSIEQTSSCTAVEQPHVDLSSAVDNPCCTIVAT